MDYVYYKSSFIHQQHWDGYFKGNSKAQNDHEASEIKNPGTSQDSNFLDSLCSRIESVYFSCFRIQTIKPTND